MKKQDLIRQLKNQRFPLKIIKAFEKTDRSKFIPHEHKQYSHEDSPLPIGHGQTTSQPYTIAFMLTLLELRDKQKILEVGSGSGYVLELISKISKNSNIFGVERIKELAENSRQALKGYENIEIIHGDGSKELKNETGFDRILVSASAPEIPQKLVNQMKFGGILVASVRDSIVVVEKTSGENKIKEYSGFRFVPLIED
jgi:protein-L-isoaspartate(D-aspartate) O-methyltransferase